MTIASGLGLLFTGIIVSVIVMFIIIKVFDIGDE
jgi:hypothetical protein